MVGGVVSLTVTVCVAVAVLPAASVAVQVTVVSPTANVLPDGLRVTVTPPAQLSLAVAVPSLALLTTVSQEVAPGPVLAVTAPGTDVNVGGVVSLTVNVMSFSDVLPAPRLLLDPSFAVM